MLVFALAVLAAPVQTADYTCASVQRQRQGLERVSQTADGSGRLVERYRVPAGATAYGLPLSDLVVEARVTPAEVTTTTRLIVAADWDAASAAGRRVTGASCSNTQDINSRCDLPDVSFLLSAYKVAVRRLNTGIQFECAQVPRPTDDW